MKKRKALYRIIFMFVLIGIIGFGIYGGIKWYKSHKAYTFYYEFCMNLKNGYNAQIQKFRQKNGDSRTFVDYVLQKQRLVTKENCDCVARWQNRTHYRKYTLELIDRIKENIGSIREYDVLLDGMFSGNISQLEKEVFAHFTGTEVDLKDCATIGFDGKVKALEELLNDHKTKLDSVGVGNMYKPKTYNVLN